MPKYPQNAVVTYTRLSSPLGKNHFHKCRPRPYELCIVCPCEDNDLAGAGWFDQPVSEEGVRSGVCELDVGSWYDKPLEDSIHLLLVRFSCTSQQSQLTETIE